METDSSGILKEPLILEDKSQYFYSITPVEIRNSLGAIIATLFEYSISNNTAKNFKLYKT